jgi:hypothetical protein
MQINYLISNQQKLNGQLSNSGFEIKISRKKILGSAAENSVGRVNGNTGIFLGGLILYTNQDFFIKTPLTK